MIRSDDDETRTLQQSRFSQLLTYMITFVSGFNYQQIRCKELKSVHEKRVLELATGSGSAVNFLPNDNQYTGTDISPGLLRKAVKRFRNAGFKNAEFYVTSANDLPFDDNLFNIVLCILSLNFFNDIKKVFH